MVLNMSRKGVNMMTIRELRSFLFGINEQDAEIINFKFSKNSPELIITIKIEGKEIDYKVKL
jgi:hypothetical protein